MLKRLFALYLSGLVVGCLMLVVLLLAGALPESSALEPVSTVSHAGEQQPTPPPAPMPHGIASVAMRARRGAANQASTRSRFTRRPW